jgi:hypothetical protein
MLFTLDNIPVSDAIDWSDLQSSLKRNDELNLLVLDQQGNITFDKDGYTYIIDKVENDGFCTFVQLNVYDYCEEGSPIEIVKARLYLSDVTIDEYNCQVQCKITDDSFFALINNNKSIKATVSAGTSKNGVAITAAESANKIEIFEPPSDSTSRTLYGVRVYEAFRFLIEFMSDGTIGFASNTFDDDTLWKGLYITSGYKIRNADQTETPPLPPFSFAELFKEINNRIPIGILIENPFTNPVVRIESLDYFYANATTFEFANIEQIKTRFDTQKLYSKVKFEQPNYYDPASSTFPADIKFRGWKEEEFHVLGQCNIDKTLDLTVDWSCSSNDFETSMGGNEDYDDKLFLIDAVYDTDNDAYNVPTNFLGLSPAQYYPNERLTNAIISTRLLGGVPNTIAAFFGNIGDGIFYAYLGASQTYNSSGNDVFDPTGFDQTLTNVGGYYDNVTNFRYDAPESGSYNFKCNINIDITAQVSAPVILWQLRLQRYDVGGTLIESKDAFIPNFTSTFTGIKYYSNSVIGGFNIGLGVTTNFVLNLGDYVTVRFDKNLGGAGDIDYTIVGGNQTYFECYNNTVGGGEFQVYDTDDFPIQIHEFEYKMSIADFQNIQANSKNSYGFYTNIDRIRYGWISELKYNHYKGVAQVKLITDKRSQSNGNRIST